MGQHMERTGTTIRKSASGYNSKISVYEAKNCQDCPLRCMCHNAKTNRRIEINHNLNRHKQKVRELLTSEEGLLHRSRRPIEPEAVFGQTKSNKHYNRFRHFNKDKVIMDFAIFAIAFNIEKMYRKSQKTGKNNRKSQKSNFCSVNLIIIAFYKENYPFAKYSHFKQSAFAA
jgi:hypothetical protein